MNPKIISWARERAGLSVESLAQKMDRDPEEIKLWEQGREFPSYTILEQMAYKYLKLPLAVFFFPAPPKIEDPVKKFRRLPNYEYARISFDTRQKIWLAQAYQDSLRFLLQSSKNRKSILHDISINGADPVDVAESAREYLGLTFEDQRRFRSSEIALKAWRHVLEGASVFTFKDSFEDRFISGFSLLSDDFPVIFINNSNAFSRQLFTLVHELGHILYGISGVTDFDESYINYMEDKDRVLEVMCNNFTANFLVPDRYFIEDIRHYRRNGPETLLNIANKYSVSREVILRKLLDHKVVTKEYYEQKANEWNKEYLGRAKKSSGGDYYLTRLAYLGEGFTGIAFENYRRGRITKTELAYHLNINARNITKLEGYMR
jgi:Zn-dependent peptidase ImmA (M78 family)